MLSRIILLHLFLASSRLQAQENYLLVRNANLVAMTSNRVQTGIDILITGNRISKIGKGLRSPAGAKVVDATGKFVMPGLCDMHTHSRDQVDTAITSNVHIPLYLVNGVTTIREMWGTPAMVERRKHRDAGQLLAPRMIVGSPILDGPDVMWPGSVAVKDTMQAFRLVDSLTSAGYDFMKVYFGVKAREFQVITREARKRNIKVVGHVPNDVRLVDAVKSGLVSIEHCTGFNYAASRNEKELRKKEQTLSKDTSRSSLVAVKKFTLELYQSFDTARLNSLVPVLLENKTWICPTLITMKGYAYRYDSSFQKDSRLQYLPKVKIGHFFPSTDPAFKEINDLDKATWNQYYLNNLEIVRHLHRAGIPMLAGSDVNNPYCFPGFSLHDELELLTSVGFTTYEALQTATVNPAIFLGKANDIGTLEEGKLADMVILNKNPLENISSTRIIHAVIVEGLHLSRSKLDTMIAEELKWAANYPIPK